MHWAPASHPVLTEEDFREFRALIREHAGIHLTEAKRELVASRLARRLRVFGYTSYGAYREHLACRDADRRELLELINCLTTNKTSFFREPHHFEFLREHVLGRRRPGTPLSIWSAGCSTGEEPYTIAITALERLGEAAAQQLRIAATDIDTRVLAQAAAGVYGESSVAELPHSLRQKYFLRGTGEAAGRVRVKEEVRRLVQFGRLNLNGDDWEQGGPYDVIFCRNVMIYFDEPTRSRLFDRFAARLRPGGYLFLGHAEGMHARGDLFEPLGNTSFRLRAAAADRVRATQAAPAAAVQASAPQADGLPRIRIHAGDVHAMARPGWIQTVLGSCVAACLFDPAAGIGGMNHFTLPANPVTDDTAPSARYGVHAMELLINEIMRLGGDRRRLQAKVFGAGSVLSSGGGSVAAQNAEFVRAFLETEGIPLVHGTLGGSLGREVRFQPHSGRAFVRELPGSAAQAALIEENGYRERLREQMSSRAAITLF